MASMRTDRPGFTLIELMAALLLTGIVMLGSVTLLGAVTDAANRIAEEGVARDAEGTSVHLVRALLERSEVTPGALDVFDGTASELSFASWCERPGGWLGRCRVGVTIPTAGAERSLWVSWEGRSPIRLGTAAADARFVFYRAGPSGGAWLKAWPAGAAAPAAIGLIEKSDTLVLPVGSSR